MGFELGDGCEARLITNDSAKNESFAFYIRTEWLEVMDDGQFSVECSSRCQ
jgi:hypothetical protein